MAKNAVEQETQPELLRTETLADEGADGAGCSQALAGAVPDVPYIRPELPDFIGRMRAIFGDKVMEVTGAELIREDRDRY